MILAAPLVIPFAEAVGISIATLGMAKAADMVNDYIQDNPEQSAMILKTLVPNLGIGEIFMNKEDSGDDEEVEVEEDTRSKKEIVLGELGKEKGNYSDEDAEGKYSSKRGRIIRALEDAGKVNPDREYNPEKKYQGYKRFIRPKKADGGAIGIEVLFEKKKDGGRAGSTMKPKRGLVNEPGGYAGLLNSFLTPQNVESGVNLLRNNVSIVDALANNLTFLPSSGRAFAKSLAGSTTPIDETFFNENQLEEIKRRTASQMAQKSMKYRPDVVNEEDPSKNEFYNTWQDKNKVVSYDQSSPISMSGIFKDPKVDIDATLGTYVYKENPDGTVSAIDKHDFSTLGGGSEYLYGAGEGADLGQGSRVDTSNLGNPKYKGELGFPFLPPTDVFGDVVKKNDPMPNSGFLETQSEPIYQSRDETIQSVFDAYKKKQITASKFARILAGFYGHQGMKVAPNSESFYPGESKAFFNMRKNWDQTGIPVNINLGKISQIDKLKANKNFANYIYNNKNIPSKIREDARVYADTQNSNKSFASQNTGTNENFSNKTGRGRTGYDDGGRVGLFMGGPALEGQALSIYNSMNAYGFDDQAIANALTEQGLYTAPGSTPDPTPDPGQTIGYQGGSDNFSPYNPDPNTIQSFKTDPRIAAANEADVRTKQLTSMGINDPFANEASLSGAYYGDMPEDTSNQIGKQSMFAKAKQGLTGLMDNPITSAIGFAINPAFGAIKGIAKGIGSMIPVNQRAIQENVMGNLGFAVNDIGQIVSTGDYNDPENVMAGYNLNRMTVDTFKNRIDKIRNRKIAQTAASRARIKAIEEAQRKFELGERLAREEKQRAEAARKGQTYTGDSDRQNIIDSSGRRDATGGDPGSRGASDQFSNRSGRGRTGYSQGGLATMFKEKR